MRKVLLIIAAIILAGCAIKEVEQMGDLKLASPAFENKGMIPAKYTCDGDDINPELLVDGIPKEAKSLVLIMDDPDAPVGTWDHWILFNVPLVSKIGENSVPGGAIQGTNSFRKLDYGGPCPPSGTHRYMFKLYALDKMLDLDEGADKSEVEAAMEGHIIAQTKLTGLYKR